MSTDSPDWIPELQEALWEAGERFGVRLAVQDQVAVARTLARMRPEHATPDDVKDAFAESGLTRPSIAYAKEVLTRVKGVRPAPSLRDVLVEYRQFAIRSLSAQFGGKTTGHEEELRNNLLTFLRRGYTEARTGRGRTDIRIPPPDDAVVEVKVWTTLQAYEDGLEELGRYIHTERPEQAFMVVFGDREPLPPIVDDHRQEIAEERELEGLLVQVVVIPFEVDQPSKAGREQRRRTRDKR